MKTQVIYALIALASARFYPGECLDMNRNFFAELGQDNFDPKRA